MKDALDLISRPYDENTWYPLLGLPICDRLEPRFMQVLNHVTSDTGQIIDSRDGYTLARWFRGKVTGLDQWGGPYKLNDAKFLIKHPNVDLAAGNRRGLGETNGILEAEGIVFALIPDRESVFAGRPLMPLFQNRILQGMRYSLQMTRPELIKPYTGLGIS